MKELTKAEEQVMQYLWKLKRGVLKDIVEQFPEPRPASTTVATVIRVLVKKGFISFKTYGKVNEYHPAISKQKYAKQHVKKVLSNFFDGSAGNMASFLTDDSDISLTELEELKQIVDKKIQQKKQQ